LPYKKLYQEDRYYHGQTPPGFRPERIPGLAADTVR